MSPESTSCVDLSALLGIEDGEGPDTTVEALLPAAGKRGRRATRAAVRTVLHHDPRWSGRLCLDLFAGQLLLDDGELTDANLTRLNCWLENVYQMTPSKDLLAEMVSCAADENPVHPVRDWLAGLSWDGTARLPDLLPRALGVSDSPLHRAYGQAFLVGAVARVMEPGCKLDTMLVLIGEQGLGKSRFCAAIVPQRAWFGDTPLDLRSKDAYTALEGKWIYEIAEMQAFRGRNAAQVKAFVSSASDRFRKPYARYASDVPRQCMFVGTSNDPELLHDRTGSRRFWPVQVTHIDLGWLTDNRDALWAEAVARYQRGEAWFLPPELEQARAASAPDFARTDPYQERLEAWPGGVSEPFTTDAAVVGALGLRGGDRAADQEVRRGAAANSLTTV